MCDSDACASSTDSCFDVQIDDMSNRFLSKSSEHCDSMLKCSEDVSVHSAVMIVPTAELDLTSASSGVNELTVYKKTSRR